MSTVPYPSYLKDVIVDTRLPDSKHVGGSYSLLKTTVEHWVGCEQFNAYNIYNEPVSLYRDEHFTLVSNEPVKVIPLTSVFEFNEDNIPF